MKKTMLKPSRFNTQTNWERIKQFMLKFRGDIDANGDHRCVCHELCEKSGLILYLNHTGRFMEANKPLVISSEEINRGTIEGHRLFVWDVGGEEIDLHFYNLVEAPIA